MKMMLVTENENKLIEVKQSGIPKVLDSEKIILYTIHIDKDGLLCIIYGERNTKNVKEENVKEIRYGTNGILRIKPPFLLARNDYGEYADITDYDIAHYLLSLSGV